MGNRGFVTKKRVVVITALLISLTIIALPGLATTATPGDEGETATHPVQSSGSVANATTAGTVGASANQRNDTAVLWRGFRHAWSYNHRLSRLGSWVDTSCRMEGPRPGSTTANCDYTVGHSAASGSGADDASFRDAYTELSGEGIGFRQSYETVRLEGKEMKSGPQNQTISGAEEVTVRLNDDLENYDDYTVLLNGFDTHTKSPPAAKIIDFEIGVSDPKTVTSNELTFDVKYRVLMDCDSAECKGGFGKGVQDIDYPLDIHYLVVGGNQSRLNVESASVDDAYSWEACDGVAHFNCGDSGRKELDYEDHIRSETISSKDDYSVNTVGYKSFSINLDSEAHFTELDMVVGGNDMANYEAHALQFFKEWSSANSPSTSYGHEGSAEVSSELRLLQIKHGCKRSFVQAGGIEWKTSHTNQRPPTDPSAVVEAPTIDYEFDFGDHWSGYTARGSRCDYDDPGIIRPSRDAAFQVNPWRARDDSTEDTWEDPTSLRLRSGDRFYPGQPSFGSRNFVDLDDVEMEFDPPRGQASVPLSGSGMTRTEGGLYIGEVDLRTSIASGSNVELEHRFYQRVDPDGTDGGGTTPFTDGRTLRTPGRYRILLVADTPGSGDVPARAVVPFRIVDSPDFIRNQVEWYRLDGPERSVRYRYDADASAWNRSVDAPGTQRRGYGVEDHVFVERAAPEMELQHPRSASMDSYISVDGTEVASGENVTEYGTHTFAAYVCYNAAADGCDSAAVSSSSQTTSTRTRPGPTKGKSTRTRSGPIKGTSKQSGSTGQSTATHPGMLGIATQNVTIVPSVGTLRNVASDVGTLPDWLLGNEQVRLLVVEDGETLQTYHATVENGEVTEVDDTSEKPATLDVEMDAETMGEIANAEDPKAAAQRAYENGELTLRSDGILNSIKFGVTRVVVDLVNLV